MSVARYLLDTSAILTLIEDDDGADRVEAILHDGEVFLPFPVLLEAYYVSLQERSEAVADERYSLLRNLSTTEIWSVDEPPMLTAARLKARFCVSFADALIAAFAVRSSAVLVDQVSQEPLPYK